MKLKKVIIMLACMLFLVTPSLFASSTVLSRKEVAKNQIELTILQTNGYVTSLNFSVQITGNVEVEKIIWNNQLKEDYLKKYVYSKSTNTLDIYLVAPHQQNLVNDDLSINVATLVLKCHQDNEPYTVGIVAKENNIVMVNNYYDKLMDTATNNANDPFYTSYEQIKPEQPGDENEENIIDGNHSGEQNNSNHIQTNTNETTNQNTTNNNQNQTPENVQDNEQEKENTEQEFENKIEEQSQKQSKTMLAFACVAGGILLLVVCGLVIIHLKKKSVN